MGLQYRKRTKGKNSWLNFSKSGISLSYKIGKNITLNSRGRATLNLGNGFRYVSYRKKKKVAKPVPEKKVVRTKYSSQPSKPKMSKEQVLSLVQQSLVNVVKLGIVVESADLEVIANLHDTVNIIKKDPNSQENRDLIIVTTNEFKDFAKKTGNPTIIKSADAVSNYLRSLIPYRYIPSPKPSPVWKSKYFWWATGIGFICFVNMFC